MTQQDSSPGVRRATIIDVAARAGVSRQTVSRAINDMPGISTSTRERVLAAAEELHYRPSRFGRGLVSAGPPTLGLLVDDLANAFFPEVARAMIRAASERGWTVLVAETGGAEDPEEVGRDLARRVDALVGYGLPQRTGDAVPERMPILSLDGPRTGDRPGVLFALDPALEELAAHLRSQGVRRAVLLDNDLTGPSDRARRVREGLAGVLEELEVVPMVPDDVRAQLDTALAASPDLLIGWNDAHALAVLKELRSRGVAVPEQVRVMGIDGLGIGTLVTPELTSLGVDLEAMAREAVDLVDGMFSGALPLLGERSRRELPYRLIRRGSA